MTPGIPAERANVSSRWIGLRSPEASAYCRICSTVTCLLSPGQALPSLSKQVTVEQIRQYAEASGDRNPIHLDETLARSAGMPGVIAHGMITMAVDRKSI